MELNIVIDILPGFGREHGGHVIRGFALNSGE